MKPHTRTHTMKYRSMTTTIKTDGLGEINANLRRSEISERLLPLKLVTNSLNVVFFSIMPRQKCVNNFGAHKIVIANLDNLIFSFCFFFISNSPRKLVI